jgi:periplasmic protein TonB
MPAPAHFESWNPKELGMTKAAAAAVALVILIAAFCYWATVVLAPKPQPQPIEVTVAQLVQLTQLPKPALPEPPKIIPRPRPAPAVIPKPIPAPGKIAVAKPPLPVRHAYRPTPQPAVQHAPAPPVPAIPKPPPALPPFSAIRAYDRQIYAILQANQNVPPALAALGASGLVLLRIIVAPDGHVVSATAIKSSGISLIDQTALSHALAAHFGPFTPGMPSTPCTFTVPVEIQTPDDNSDSN